MSFYLAIAAIVLAGCALALANPRLTRRYKISLGKDRWGVFDSEAGERAFANPEAWAKTPEGKASLVEARKFWNINDRTFAQRVREAVRAFRRR